MNINATRVTTVRWRRRFRARANCHFDDYLICIYCSKTYYVAGKTHGLLSGKKDDLRVGERARIPVGVEAVNVTTLEYKACATNPGERALGLIPNAQSFVFSPIQFLVTQNFNSLC